MLVGWSDRYATSIEIICWHPFANGVSYICRDKRFVLISWAMEALGYISGNCGGDRQGCSQWHRLALVGHLGIGIICHCEMEYFVVYLAIFWRRCIQKSNEYVSVLSARLMVVPVQFAVGMDVSMCDDYVYGFHWHILDW